MTQAQALSILKTGANVFLTGEPGAGKSYVINQYAEYLRERGIEPAITASTGIAATHIGGSTIHSWSGIGVSKRLDEYELDKITSSEHISKRIRGARVLIIDEVSMLSSQTLSLVDRVCREVKQNFDPFGGLQVILVGDFFQLPPVGKLEPEDLDLFMDEEPPGRFAFNSSVWTEARPIVSYLTEQHRQDDDGFLYILSAIRQNTFDKKHMASLATRKIDEGKLPNGVLKLFSHNLDVDRINDDMLRAIPGDIRNFEMTSSGAERIVAGLKKNCLSPEKLSLKLGAKVMFTKNNQRDGFVNGTLGEVVKFDKQSGYPAVKTLGGDFIQTSLAEWTVEENGRVRAKIEQLPLRLAWAMTVHKSQGMSLDEAVMDLSRVFEYGQGYVALSRVRRLSGLHLIGWNNRTFRVHPEILEKDLIFRAQSEDSEEAFANLTAPVLKKMHENFIIVCGGRNIDDRDDTKIERTKSVRAKKNPWERTRELIAEGKTVPEMAKLEAKTEDTILKHLEKLLASGVYKKEELNYLLEGNEKDKAEVHLAIKIVGVEKLKPIYEQCGGRISYETIKIARLLYE